ncbi:MAG: AraC family transcriptional regulator [Victivallales bacterium]
MLKINENYGMVLRSYAFKDQDFPVAVQKIQNARPIAPHIHENFDEIVLVTDGVCRHKIEGQCYDIGSGDIFVISGTKIHSYEASEHFTYYNILVDFKKLNLPLLDLPTNTGYQVLFMIDRHSRDRERFKQRFRLNFEQLNQCGEHLERLRAVLDRKNPGYQFVASGMLMQFIGFICQCYTADNTASSNNSTPHLLGKLAGEMERYPTHRFTIEEMCARTNMSRAVFFREFKKYYHAAPLDYLLHLRVQRASGLLSNTAMRIGEIALECGFSDNSYFTLQFRRHAGLAPKQFRRRFQIKKIDGKKQP